MYILQIFLYLIVFSASLGEDPNFYENDYNENINARYDLKPSINYKNSPLSTGSSEVKNEDEEVIQIIDAGSHRGSSSYSYDEEKEDEDDGSYDGTYVDSIPGKIGKDFPAYTEIPKTGFSCKGKKVAGYFADVETDCQVFHVCLAGGQKISFLCPNGSIFNQKVLVCDWWYDVDCESSARILDHSNDIQKNSVYHQNEEKQEDFYRYYTNDNYVVDNENYDLNLASSGGNESPSYSQIKNEKSNEKRLESNNVKNRKNNDENRYKNLNYDTTESNGRRNELKNDFDGDYSNVRKNDLNDENNVKNGTQRNIRERFNN